MLLHHYSTSSHSTPSFSHLHRRHPFPSHDRSFNTQSPRSDRTPILPSKNPISLSSINPSPHFPICKSHPETPRTTLDADVTAPSMGHKKMENFQLGEKEMDQKKQNKSFWGAVTLIIGTAVGPGMLGLPSATIRSGPIPSTIAIILSWVYVVSSIVLVAELSFAAMEEDRVKEVSFTALATSAFGPGLGAFVAVVYASLSFALIIACVSGIGSLIAQQFPMVNLVAAHAIFPCFVGTVIGLFPFKVVDMTNRFLCSLMLFSITALVAIGVSVGRSKLLGSLAYANWKPEAILPAIPVTVLTLGFHVITPFVCRLVGDSMYDARKAILLGGFVPLAMVLSWNAVVLGLAVTGSTAYKDPIKLLLSVNPAALPAVRGFAFAALATSLIGYAVSFPKQLADTMKLIAQWFDRTPMERCQVVLSLTGNRRFVNSDENDQASRKMGAFKDDASLISSNWANQEVAMESHREILSKDCSNESTNGALPLDAGSNSGPVMWVVLVIPIFIASFFNAAFAKALTFAGVYANCFLFGVLPPAMAWIYRSKKRQRSVTCKEDLLPGGNIVLAILFSIAIILGFWH